MTLDVGSTIEGRYELTGLLGKGGYGSVYRARQLNMDRDVAIKVILPHLISDERIVKRFLREARAVSRLKNPHIVQVYDSGCTGDGTLYIVMELLQGRSLKDIFAEQAPMEPRRLAKLLAQVCEALAEAHSFTPPGTTEPAPIVHRDLKPENVMVATSRAGSEHCYLLDFGIVRMADEEIDLDASLTGGMAVGTPYYMSPEQGYGERVTPAADLWALGVMLYQGLCGKRPFGGKSVLAIVQAVTQDPTPPLQVPDGHLEPPLALVQLVEQLLQKDPAQRPQSAADVQQVLLMVAATGTPHPPFRPMPKLHPPPPAVPPPVSESAQLPALAAQPTAAALPAPMAHPSRALRWMAVVAVLVLTVAAIGWVVVGQVSPPAKAAAVVVAPAVAEPPVVVVPPPVLPAVAVAAPATVTPAAPAPADPAAAAPADPAIAAPPSKPRPRVRDEAKPAVKPAVKVGPKVNLD